MSLQHISGMLESLCISWRKPILYIYISSQLHIQKRHIGRLKLTIVEYLHHRYQETLKIKAVLHTPPLPHR